MAKSAPVSCGTAQNPREDASAGEAVAAVSANASATPDIAANAPPSLFKNASGDDNARDHFAVSRPTVLIFARFKLPRRRCIKERTATDARAGMRIGLMGRAYLNAQLDELGMRDFETQLSRVATSVIGDDACGQMLAGDAGALDTTIKQMIAYMLGSGTYGTISNNVKNRLAKEANEHGQKGSRARYLLHRAFPPLESLKQGYPVLKRAPYLLPCVYAYRFAVKPFASAAKLRTELSIVAKENKE